jgi:acetyl esterase/lipase
MSSITVRAIAENKSLFANPEAGNPARMDADMQHVLNVLAGMDPRPIESCTAPEARAQPSLAVAVRRILLDPADDGGVNMELRLIPGAAGEIRARIYTPRVLDALLAPPVLLYIHGGGWVMGDLDSYDATPRMLARRLGAVVVSTHYRQAPEFKFPAAHEDVLAAWRWTLDNAEALGADPLLAAVVGEGSGANMALNLCIDAREAGLRVPLHQALVTPMAGTDFDLASYGQNAGTVPLSAAGVRWFYKKLLRNKADAADRRLNPAERDLYGLPPATIILAEHDPLRSEGELLADALRRSGVWTDCTTYDGVTHGFFGLAQVVNKAMFAQGQVARNLTEAFGRG